MKKINLLTMLFFMAAGSAFAQQGDLKKEPGFFEFSQLSSLRSGEMISEVYLEEPLLKMVAGMTGESEEGVGNLIAALKLVKVQEFMVDEKEIERVEKTIESMDTELQNLKWQRIIKSRNKGNFTNVYVKPSSDGGYAGLVITSLDGKGKVSFVNIVGNIDLESIGKLSKQFNLPKVDKK
ncbi:MAG: DUF4252 domain-containing protein [Melioribacteraceae bacterium]|nr:DUF4252 domain-containing protein [Melioribacteraceae bacterium]